MADVYQVLGVSVHASLGEIREAYKRKVLIHHPDKGGEASSFRLVHLAFETLSTSSRRQSYDAHAALYKRRASSSVKKTGGPTRATSRYSPPVVSTGEPLGAGVPPKKRDRKGQRPRALLLRTLRRLHCLLKAQPTESRRQTISSLSKFLRVELAAFIVHQEARGGEDQAGAGSRRVERAAGAAGQQRLWLCRWIGRASVAGRCRVSGARASAY